MLLLAGENGTIEREREGSLESNREAALWFLFGREEVVGGRKGEGGCGLWGLDYKERR